MATSLSSSSSHSAAVVVQTRPLLRKQALPKNSSFIDNVQSLTDCYDHASKWLVVFFWINDCPACKKFKPVWEAEIRLTLAKTRNFKFMEIDMSDEKSLFNVDLETRFDVFGFPTVLAFPPASKLSRASCHSLILYKGNMPSLSASLLALLDAHPSQWCTIVPPAAGGDCARCTSASSSSSSSNNSNGQRWCDIAGAVCAPTLVASKPTMAVRFESTPLACGLNYCVKRSAKTN